MKRLFSLIILLLFSCLCYAGNVMKFNTADTSDSKHTNSPAFTAPQYPGGIDRFNNYIKRNLQYPWAARLMCIKGDVYVSFIVDEIGKVTNVTAMNCVGAGCESEAIKVVQNSRSWKPGTRNGRPVSTSYVVPISFFMEPEKIFLENLNASSYGFVFKINGRLCTIDEAEGLLGKVIKPELIESAEPYHTDDTRFKLQRKNEAFLISVK